MRKRTILPFVHSECVEHSQPIPCEFESLGQRIRNAVDQGVSPDVNPQTLMYDDEDSGDVVDPNADPRFDGFTAIDALEGIHAKMTTD